MTPEDGDASSWWIDDAGPPLGAERAIAQSLMAMAGAWRLLGFLLLVPGIAYASAVGYRLIAEDWGLMPGRASRKVERLSMPER